MFVFVGVCCLCLFGVVKYCLVLFSVACSRVLYSLFSLFVFGCWLVGVGLVVCDVVCWVFVVALLFVGCHLLFVMCCLIARC